MVEVRETWLPQPDLDSLDVGVILHALADPVRLQIVQSLDALGEAACTELDLPVKLSTVSHHMAIMRECGVISTRIDGKARRSRLRRAELEKRFPGLLDAITSATPPKVTG